MKFYCHLTKPRAVDGDVSLVEVSALGAGSGGWIWGQGSHFPVRVRDVLLITLSRLQRGGREAGGRQLSTARPGRGRSVRLSPQIHRRFLFLMIFSAAVPSYSLFYHKTKCVGRPLTLLARPRIGVVFGGSAATHQFPPPGTPGASRSQKPQLRRKVGPSPARLQLGFELRARCLVTSSQAPLPARPQPASDSVNADGWGICPPSGESPGLKWQGHSHLSLTTGQGPSAISVPRILHDARDLVHLQRC